MTHHRGQALLQVNGLDHGLAVTASESAQLLVDLRSSRVQAKGRCTVEGRQEQSKKLHHGGLVVYFVNRVLKRGRRWTQWIGNERFSATVLIDPIGGW